MSELYGIELLRRLSLAFGPTGCEGDVADIIEETISGFADEISRDRKGNVVAVLYGKNHGTADERRFMFSAHMDEVGFMITDINGDGTLKFTNLGGIVPSVLPARRVTVKGSCGEYIPAVIGSKPIHLQEGGERGKAEGISSLYIDIGAKDKEDAQKYVSRGDFATFSSDFVRFGHEEKQIKCKALDDRFGCAVECDALRTLSREERGGADIIFAFTVSEEIGKSGAKTAAYRVNPHVAVVLEATAVADNMGLPETSRVAEQGKGPAVSFMDKGTVYGRDMYKAVMETADVHGIPAQPKRFVSGGNDAAHIQRIRGGVHVAAVSAPARYIHTAVDTINADDYESTVSLALALARDADRIIGGLSEQ
ncbi:MAG: M20/M25/M40 family metallo-hydrolase [Firmicutes bacterium]|nr:M20/M25/M40 family metallo-hydrolase [Bacillota bacterium]